MYKQFEINKSIIRTILSYLSFLLLPMPLFAQYNPKEYIAKDIQNLRTHQLKGEVKYTRTIEYDKTGEVVGLEIKWFDEKGNVVQCSKEDYPLSPYGGCMEEIRIYDYDNDGRLIGVFWTERGCFGDYYAVGDYYTIKYDEKGRPVAITWYDQGEYSSKIEDFDIKPKRVFENLDSKKITGQISYLYDNQGRLVVSQGAKNKNNSDDRVIFEYDDFGRIIKEVSYWHEYDKDNDGKQQVSMSYYTYNNGTTIKIEEKNSVIEKLYCYDSTFFQIDSLKKLQSAFNIVYDFGKYNKKNKNIVLDSNNPFDVLPLLYAVIDTSMNVMFEKNGQQFDDDGLCIQRIYNEGISGDPNDMSSIDVVIKYNTNGNKIEETGSWLKWYGNYQYDNFDNWIRYDFYANKEHAFFYSYKRRIEYFNNKPNQTVHADNGQVYTANGVSFVMKDVNGGTFQMGTDSETSLERPAHLVTVSDFAIGETEVTQGLWIAVMGSNPSKNQGNDLPVDNVSYNDIVNEFLPKLNQMTGQNFRLPTEAEWEFAARGGNNSKGYQYAGSNHLDDVAWYWKNTGDNYLDGTDDDWNWDNIVNNNGRTGSVKGKSPNELGVYGMSGNVWEWCSDEWHFYNSTLEIDPRYYGDSNSKRVQRGGCWCSRTGDCRVTSRSGKKPEEHYPKWGFRIALSR